LSAATGIHEELANCGHNHKSVETATACLRRLTKPYEDGGIPATWYHAQVEDNETADIVEAWAMRRRARVARVPDGSQAIKRRWGAHQVIMKSIRVHFDNGDTLETSINGTDAEIRAYYLDNMFNLGHEDDVMVRAVRVDFL
jgi:hypothetical protein